MFRIYIRRLVAEFNSTTQCLLDAAAQRGAERTDVARTVAHQRRLFYGILAKLEVLLILDALAFDSRASLDLVHRLENLQVECRALVPASAESA